VQTLEKSWETISYYVLEFIFFSENLDLLMLKLVICSIFFRQKVANKSGDKNEKKMFHHICDYLI